MRTSLLLPLLFAIMACGSTPEPPTAADEPIVNGFLEIDNTQVPAHTLDISDDGYETEIRLVGYFDQRYVMVQLYLRAPILAGSLLYSSDDQLRARRCEGATEGVWEWDENADFTRVLIKDSPIPGYDRLHFSLNTSNKRGLETLSGTVDVIKGYYP